jgi:hypothetical protein
MIFFVTASGRAAENDASEARAAYDSAAAAYDAGDFGAAAERFARADELAPNATALKLALAAAVRAETPILAVNLALRAERRPSPDGDTLRLARAARQQFDARVGLLTVRCADGHVCRVRIGEQRLELDQPFALLPGKVELTFSEAQASVTRTVEVVAARSLEMTEPPLAPRAPSGASPSPATTGAVTTPASTYQPSGLSPAVFWSGLVLSGALTGASIASGVDAAHAHDAFLAQRTKDTEERGQAAVERTNVLIGTTVGVAVLSAAIGLLFTKWPSPVQASAGMQSLRIAF